MTKTSKSTKSYKKSVSGTKKRCIRGGAAKLNKVIEQIEKKQENSSTMKKIKRNITELTESIEGATEFSKEINKETNGHNINVNAKLIKLDKDLSSEIQLINKNMNELLKNSESSSFKTENNLYSEEIEELVQGTTIEETINIIDELKKK